MKVTYLLGNGFDINLGLETSYKNFYDYYITQKPNNLVDNDLNLHIIDELKKDISENVEQWSDLEEKLGVYTKKLNDISEYIYIIEDIRFNLQNFLQSKCDSVNFDLNSNKVFSRLIHDFTNPENYLSREYKEQIKAFKNPGSAFNISTITFNYTNILEKINNGTQFISRDFRDNGIMYILNPIQHIHGYIDQRMVIGVDNEDQILNSNFRKNNKYLRRLIKSKINATYHLRHQDDCQNIIMNTDFFILFGLSYGETDKTWWNLIGQRFINDQNSMLLIFHYIKDFIDNGHKGPDKEELIDEIKERFINKMGLDDYDFEMLEKRIIVAINTEIFKLQN